MRLAMFFWLALAIMVLGCHEDDPLPSQNSAKMLAGDPGQSRSWKLISISDQVEQGNPLPMPLADCIKDNVYTFTNNSDQSYAATEGETKCFNSDPDQIESGTWAFTTDGKIVMILSTTIIPTSQGTLFSYFGFAFPAEVIALKSDSFKIRMTYTKQQGVASITHYYVFIFVRA